MICDLQAATIKLRDVIGILSAPKFEEFKEVTHDKESKKWIL